MAKKYWITRDDVEDGYFFWSKKPKWMFVGLARKEWYAGNGFACGLPDEFVEGVLNIKLSGGKDSIVCITGFKAVR